MKLEDLPTFEEAKQMLNTIAYDYSKFEKEYLLHYFVYQYTPSFVDEDIWRKDLIDAVNFFIERGEK